MQTNTVLPKHPATRQSDTQFPLSLLNTVRQRCWSAVKVQVLWCLSEYTIKQSAVYRAGRMAYFEPTLVTLVPVATFRISPAPQLYTFDNMDDMVELQDDPELYQASSQVSRQDDKHWRVVLLRMCS